MFVYKSQKDVKATAGQHDYIIEIAPRRYTLAPTVADALRSATEANTPTHNQAEDAITDLHRQLVDYDGPAPIVRYCAGWWTVVP